MKRLWPEEEDFFLICLVILVFGVFCISAALSVLIK